MEKWNCKQRAFQWVTHSSLLNNMLDSLYGACGRAARDVQRRLLVTAVAKLMREAHQHGFEKGYREGVKVGKKISMDVIIHDYQQALKGE